MSACQRWTPAKRKFAILQFVFDQGEKAAKAAEKINLVYGPDTVNKRLAQKWFARFRSGNFDVKDAPRVGRPVVENCDKIIKIVETDRHLSIYSIGEELKISQKPFGTICITLD